MYPPEVKEYAEEQENELKCLEYRIHQHSGDSRNVNRNPYMRDYARVLYSSSFRRLQGKMQLLGIDSKKFNRNRLTHSLEVAQIARAIATDLGVHDVAVVETAALAHDIGNPPFGHCGERILNELGNGAEGMKAMLKHYEF